MNILKRIKNLKEQIKHKISNIDYVGIVIRLIPILFFIWFILPKLIYIISGFEGKPRISEGLEVYIEYIVISFIIRNIWISRLVPIIKNIFKNPCHLHIWNFITLVIITKYCNINVIGLYLYLYKILINSVVFNYLSYISYLEFF